MNPLNNFIFGVCIGVALSIAVVKLAPKPPDKAETTYIVIPTPAPVFPLPRSTPATPIPDPKAWMKAPTKLDQTPTPRPPKVIQR